LARKTNGYTPGHDKNIKATVFYAILTKMSFRYIFDYSIKLNNRNDPLLSTIFNVSLSPLGEKRYLLLILKYLKVINVGITETAEINVFSSCIISHTTDMVYLL
jgi:hypothetical protein